MQAKQAIFRMVNRCFLSTVLICFLLLSIGCRQKEFRSKSIEDIVVDSVLIHLHSPGEQFFTYMNDSTLFSYERDAALIREYDTQTDTIRLRKEVKLDPLSWTLNPNFLDHGSYHRMVDDFYGEIWRYENGVHYNTKQKISHPLLPTFSVDIFQSHDIIRFGDTVIFGRIFDWETEEQYDAWIQHPPFCLFKNTADSFEYLTSLGKNYPSIEDMRSPWINYIYNPKNHHIAYLYEDVDRLYFLDLHSSETSSIPLHNPDFKNNTVYKNEEKARKNEGAHYKYFLQHPRSGNYMLLYSLAHGPKKRKKYAALILDQNYEVLYRVDLKQYYLVIQGAIYYHPKKATTMITDLNKAIEWKNEMYIYTLDY